MQFLPPDGCFPFVIMTVDNRAEHLGYFPEIPDVLYGYPQIRYAFSLKNMLFDSWGPDVVDKCSKIKISLFLTENMGKFFSVMHKHYISLLGLSFGLIGCFGMISSPCMNIAYCSDDISRASSAERGQLNAPLSNLL